MTEKPFRELIHEQIELRSDWSDAAILNDLKALPVLPDEYLWFGKTGIGHPVWDEPETETHLATFLALAGLVAERRLREGVLLLLERSSYGDVGETMRGLRHALERAFNPDWEALTDVCLQAAHSPYRGARLWAVHELGILRNPRSLDTLLEALYDPAEMVRDWAIHSLGMLSDHSTDMKAQIIIELEKYLEQLHTAQFQTLAIVRKLRAEQSNEG